MTLRKRITFGAALLLMARLAYAGQPGGSGPVTVRVVDSTGKPVPDAEVELFGIERSARMPILWEDWDFSSGRPPKVTATKPDGVWSFNTDSKGECVVRFWRRDYADNNKVGDPYVPIFGEFYLLAMKDGFAGGVSRQVHNLPPGETSDFEPDEWANTKRTAVKVDGQPPQSAVVIVLCRGIRISGRATDTDGKPAAGRKIAIYHDLHVATHTGYGGEFWPQTAMTDADGGFRFDNVYPGRTYIISDGHWARTCVNGKWSDGPVDYLDPSPTQETILKLVFSQKPLHTYSGKVEDQTGKPVPGLKLCIGLSMHWPPENYSDEHRFEYTVTGADGRYKLETDELFVRFVKPDNGTGFKGNSGGDIRPVRNFDLQVAGSAGN